MLTKEEKEAFLAGVSITLFVLGIACVACAVIDRASNFPYEESMFGFLGGGFGVLAIIFHRADAVLRWACRLLAVMFIAMALSPFWY
ncbi:MAG: hypothetical protein UY31_C0062G0001 [Candidatus Wolfebacteria bacterium GW2011_GWE1_48_7]|uniref:Uncharacterized protein n=2 Tax=Candidatus Wolfeibacteriota TaxID=1752735 RepID=A0A0G1WG02_9BACT|nr:MAG: hypothetical protein UX70_C0001G1065 [Candidatus Wolfebacteria bacterium GW2011_GWB1_47_1]KKU65400.1 MAG: hypothetical protein UX90_C0006G0003 [Candidatus Wolfebacteria bacterium GW2011_GWD2_47_17]KKU76248.1 MAG: hypothetical protein UY00_C0018G0002 [Candidatus Wolfebacteria bacterium GW2011_GWA1_47_6]KKU89253.1 MAG: hypothetical protein UY19_C0017G0019 [Candidatus Wolfebacteria bacterium GW2011_GWA2_47_9b]KKU98040.1 MAG: hypothetical protein UY31_C0062G0001 [Candidatus Wolfebacteria ba